MDLDASRADWINTFVGILDTALSLDDAELIATTDVMTGLLDRLAVPGRNRPRELPVAVALEKSAGVYSSQIHGTRDAGLQRRSARIGPADLSVELEAWRDALLSMLTSAYPDLEGFERLEATVILDQLLISLGLPDRACSFLPDDVVRAHVAATDPTCQVAESTVGS